MKHGSADAAVCAKVKESAATGVGRLFAAAIGANEFGNEDDWGTGPDRSKEEIITRM
jgi:hypothetical protein